ncbi:MAG: hypothetical protein AB7S78_06400 [Candidatus Omnitrophota bacterium]
MSSETVWILLIMSLAIIVLFNWGYGPTWGYLPGGSLLFVWLVVLTLVVVKPGQTRYVEADNVSPLQQEEDKDPKDFLQHVNVSLQDVPLSKRFLRFQ